MLFKFFEFFYVLNLFSFWYTNKRYYFNIFLNKKILQKTISIYTIKHIYVLKQKYFMRAFTYKLRG